MSEIPAVSTEVIPEAFKPGLVSILIVNWNTREHLARCLDALANGCMPTQSEVIIVDNASSDGSADMVSKHYAQFILIRNESNPGFACSINQAASHARGDLLLFLNSDTLLEQNTISVCRNYLLAQEDIAVVGCKLRFPDGKSQSSTFRFPNLRGVFLTSLWLSQAFPNSFILNWNRYGNREWAKPQDVDVVMGSFLLLRRSVLEGSHPLDDDYFMYGEECDMCRNLLQKGWRTVYLPNANLIHAHGGSTKTPALEGWARDAKTRGILLYFWKWRGTTIAWFANLLMLFGLIPRLFVWGFSDLTRGIASGRPLVHKLYKGKVFWFHILVLFKPRAIRQKWSGPDAIRTDHK